MIIIIMSIYLLFIYFASKYLYSINQIIGIWIGIIAIATYLLICKLVLYTYWVI